MKRSSEPDTPQLGLFNPAALAAARLQGALEMQAPAPAPEIEDEPSPAPEPAPAASAPAPPPPPAPALPWAAPAGGFPATALYLDAQALIERCMHSPKLRESRSRRGAPNGILRGFVRTLLGALGQHSPAAVAVVFDVADNASRRQRRERVPQYQAAVAPLPPDVDAQEAMCQHVCQLLGCYAIASDRAEARDVIGTLVSRTPEDWSVIVCSARTSLLELGQHPGCSLSWRRHGADVLEPAEAACRHRLGIAPHQVPLFLALSGASEGLPGLRGIGEATARALVTEFKTFEALQEVLALGLPDVLLRVIGSAQIRNGQRIGRRLLEAQAELPELVRAAALQRDVHDDLIVPEVEELPQLLIRSPAAEAELRQLGEDWSINDLCRDIDPGEEVLE